MATTVAAPARRRSGWRLLFKFLLALIVVIVVVVAGLYGWLYRVGHASLAQLEGTIALQGLSAPVSVVRDAHGVPHITAANLEDLFFAQGYVTAQDRLWQMDMTRRGVAGELSEILGGDGGPRPPISRSTAAPRPRVTWLAYDKQQRILRLRAVAERVASQLSERDRKFFDAYARGVNAFIAQHRDNLPIEFRILRYQPREWTAADSVLVGIGMSQILNPQYETEYWREKIAQKLSPELMSDLYPVGSWRDHPPASEASTDALEKKQSAVSSQHSREHSAISIQHSAYETTWSQTKTVVGHSDGSGEALAPGSNNWVVSGTHSTTGKPLLSNDMHLPHRVPGIWYEAHLHSGDFNVEGFTLPGTPFVIVGHNQRIAWGFTNLNPDVQDLFVENFNPEGEYQTPSGWQKPEKVHEIIHVKGEPDVRFEVTVTRHGPIVTSLFPGETRQIALEWLAYDTRQINIPLFDLDSAQNWDQFRKALSVFATPSQNVVYGDVDGNIGYQAMGFVPIRATGDGTLPVSGADGEHDWAGYLPFDKMPSVYNPPSGIIATANGKIVPDGYPYLVGTQWWPPYRTERIYKVLKSGKKFSPADMLALQTDITSEYDRFFADRFVYAIDHSAKATARAHEAADLMRGFDGRLLAGSVAPTIEVSARRELWELLLAPKLGPDWDRYEWSDSSVALENIVQQEPARWLPPGYANFNDLLTAAVDAALLDAPKNLKSWKYGDAYPVVITHPVLAAIPGFRGISAPGRQPQSGGSFTVKQVGRTFGPSERMTVDFADLDHSTFNIVLGESGQLYSPYYMDQWPAWYGNTTFNLAYSDAAVQTGKAHQLTLAPK